MKKFLSLLLTGILFLNCCIGLQAALPETIMPLWDNISQIDNIITFDGNDGYASATITGKSGTTNITATLTVYKETDRGWVYVTSDSDSINGRELMLSVEFTGKTDGSYKSVVRITVTRNGVDETETNTAYGTC